MSGLNLTKTGMIRLGRLLRNELERQGVEQKILVARLAQIGHSTNKDKVSRLVKGDGSNADPLLLYAIAKLRLICSPAGCPYTLEDFLLILCEQLDPFEVQARPQWHSEAIALIRDAQGDRSVEEFAAACLLPVRVVTEILQGRSPGWEELIKLSTQPPTRQSQVDHLLALAEHYGVTISKAGRCTSIHCG